MVDVANVPKMAIMVTSESTALEPFKAGVLPELLMKAAAHQTVLREAGSTDVFGLEGRFDVKLEIGQVDCSICGIRNSGAGTSF